MNTTTSWIIKEKITGRIVMETYDKKKVDVLNIERYEAVPISEHLSGLSGIREMKKQPVDAVPVRQGNKLPKVGGGHDAARRGAGT